MIKELILNKKYGFITLDMLFEIFFVVFIFLLLFTVYSFIKKKGWKFFLVSILFNYCLVVLLMAFSMLIFNRHNELKYWKALHSEDFGSQVYFYINDVRPTRYRNPIFDNLMKFGVDGARYAFIKLNSEKESKKQNDYWFLLREYASTPIKAERSLDECLQDSYGVYNSKNAACRVEFELSFMIKDELLSQNYKKCSREVYNNHNDTNDNCYDEYEQMKEAFVIADRDIYNLVKLRFQFGSNIDKFYAGRLLKEIYNEELSQNYFDQFIDIKDQVIWIEEK